MTQGCWDGRTEVAEWLSLSDRAAGPAPSVVELVGQRLVEYEHEAALAVTDVYRFEHALNGDQPRPVWVSFPVTFQVR